MTGIARRHPQLTFLALAATINLAATIIAHSVTDPARHTRVAVAAVCDMTITVTALYYWLVVRPGLRPKATLLLIALLGLLRAAFAFPEVIPGRAWIAGASEIFVIGAVIAVLRSPGDDPVLRIQEALNRIIPLGTAGRALAGELAVLYYAFAWRAKPHLPVNARPFTMHRNTGIADLILVLAPVSLLEIMPIHLLAAHWSVALSWILAGLSLYGALWIFALGRSFALRPGFITETEIVVRFGLLFTLRIPRECIRSISHTAIAGAVPVPRRAIPNLYLEFTRPLEAERMLGFKKQIGVLGLCLDDLAAFRVEPDTCRTTPSAESQYPPVCRL